MSDPEEAAKRLETAPKRYVRGRLAALLPAIDQAIKDGARREDLVVALREQEVEVSFENLKKALYRYRREKRSEATQSVPSPTARSLDDQGEPEGPRPRPFPPPATPGAAFESERAETLDNSIIPAAERVAMALDPARRNAVADEFMKPKPRPLLGTKPKGEK